MSELPRPSLPLFVFVSGKPGSGKTTLAQRLADALWLPLVSNDAIRQGLFETRAAARGEAARLADVVDGPTAVGVFFSAIGFLLSAGVSLIADHSFRRGLSEPDLRPLVQSARLVNIHCDTLIEEAQRRFLQRERTQRRLFVEDLRRHRPETFQRHDADYVVDQIERGAYDWTVFDPLDLDVPRLRVDTTGEYVPSLDRIVAFIRSASRDGSSRAP
ncbi:MAG TPA: AAA family ATPase [Chloroflexota bacterium]|nr:AAA family ATPase [Chloroflexota bacterium]